MDIPQEDVEAMPVTGFDEVRRIRERIETVIVGQDAAVRHLLVGLLSGGHVLIEDVPGVGKTTLARSLARTLAGSFQRVQFTPDLLPSDLTGISVYDRDQKCFTFHPGPVFANIVLADEINRTTPRTQSALLEAMNVGQVSVDGQTHELPRPFMVVATQNPLEFTGTYPLPESQLDRFLLRLRMGVPGFEDEKRILQSRRQSDPIDALKPAVSQETVEGLIAQVRHVRVQEDVLEYLLRIVEATRQHRRVLLGGSPRASLGLYRAAQAHAFADARDFVMPDDVKALAVPVLAHRLVLRETDALTTRGENEALVAEILDALPVPQ
jgi:MoxR-like ATPase